jgi:hypothetical protein
MEVMGECARAMESEFVNVSVLNEMYMVVHQPQVVDL